MDGQPLALTKTSDTWQTNIPAHTSGKAAILITGKQNNQSFTRSLEYMVDQTLTRDAQSGSTYTASFNTTGGSQAPQPRQIPYPYGRVQRPYPDSTRSDYQFEGWFTGNTATTSAHLSPKHHAHRPLDQQNPRTTWTINPNKGNQFGNETTTITPPDSRSGVKFNQISNSIGSGKMHNSVSLAVGSDGYVYAWGDNTNGQLGNGTSSGFNGANPVPGRVRDPNHPDDTSKNLKSVQISAGFEHTIAIDAQGNTWSWGWNYWGELGQNTKTDRIFVPTQVYNPDNPAIAFKASQVSAGYDTSLAIDTNGVAWSWGRNDYGQLGYTNYDSSTVHRQPAKVRNPASPKNTDLSLNSSLVSAGNWDSLAIGKDGYTYAWGYNSYGQLGNNSYKDAYAPVLVEFNLSRVISAARFDSSPGTNLTNINNSNSVTVLTPAHVPGTVTVSVDYTMGGSGQTLTDTSLRYTYTPAGVLPRAGGEGVMLALATGMTGMGAVLASRRHRREQHRLLHALHE